MAYDIQDASRVESLTVNEVKELLGDAEMEDINSDGDGALQYDLPLGYYLEVTISGGRCASADVIDPG